MHKKSKLLALAGMTLAVFAVSAPARAQATRTWVSGVGDDLNPCSRTAPCKTFAAAFSKTFINGEIDCLDPGGYGTITITKSITIDCTGTFGSILASGTTGVTISIAVNANDPFRTVRLRGLSINGSGASGTIGTRTGVRGVRILDAAVVEIEDTVITDFVTAGIADARTSTGGKLSIRNSVIRDVTGSGISAAGPTPTTSRSKTSTRSTTASASPPPRETGSASSGRYSPAIQRPASNPTSVAKSAWTMPLSPETAPVCKTPERCRSPIRRFTSTRREFPEPPPRSGTTGSSAMVRRARVQPSVRPRRITVSSNNDLPCENRSPGRPSARGFQFFPARCRVRLPFSLTVPPALRYGFSCLARLGCLATGETGIGDEQRLRQ